jgi:transposase
MRQARLWEGETEAGAAPAAVRAPGGRGKPRVKPIDRSQMRLRPVKVEGLIREEHPARAIWEFVGRLDLGAYYEKIQAREDEAGRPAMDPRLMISLWVLAYSEGVSSAREVERLCEYDPAYQWLTGMTGVNYHTLSDFRVDHQEALDELFTQILGVLSADGLVTLERVMVDGTKVKAYAGADTFRREGKLRAHLELARQQVEAMGDPRSEEWPARQKARRERAAKERHQRLERAWAELEKVRATKTGEEAQQEARVSETEPECRVMKHADGAYKPSYNVQLATDEAAGIIVAPAVDASPSDYGQLEPQMERVRKNAGRRPAQAVVDGGFMSRRTILAMEAQGVDLIGAMDEKKAQSAGQFERRGVSPEFRPESFRYEPESDTCRCPAGKVLRYEDQDKAVGITYRNYRALEADCAACAFKPKCCPQTHGQGRRIVRSQEDPGVVAFRRKMETPEAQAIYRRRGPAAEFVNAWLKEKIGLRQFRLQGLVKVGMELLWACLTYNIQQWIRLRWAVAGAAG